MSLLTHDEISLLASDSKYKNYVSSIEKSLKNFESSSEWADLISSLGKLKKCLQSFPKYQYIPKRVSVCKRLAQCLHPALPSGVHLKALEVYTCIFQNIGTENLSKDLFLYSSGLFPLLANAALSVKPILLNLYETYFLPLKKSLRPCLTGLLIGLLPGLEEGSDFYQRTFNLLKNICLAQSDLSNNNNQTQSSTSPNTNNYIADDKYFYTCLWSAIIAQSSIRFPAIQFILSNYENKKRTTTTTTATTTTSTTNNNNTNSTNNTTISSQNLVEDQLYLIGNSIDLMINAICCCLQDPNPLVQRTILDLVCLCLPINTKNITKGDKLQLIVVAIHVVLRRDMSLNRRIYSWLMGVSSSSSSTSNTTDDTGLVQIKSTANEENYFNTHSKTLLIQSIKMLLNKKETSSILYLLNDESLNQVSSNTLNPNSATISQTSANTNTTLKLLKIVSNLVERQEIGQAIIDDILLDLLFYVYKEYSYLNMNNTSTSVQFYLNLKKNYSVNYQQQQNQQQQNLKESNELKKATCNFLFQSFQIYFIWEFCSNKFELICKNHTNLLNSTNNNNNSNSLPSISNTTSTSNSQDLNNTLLTPAQLCDLYEFILDLSANSDIYNNEIQTEHLPLMLKRIIQSLNVYCEKMTNLDLTKSLLLCLKILNKVVPKIIVPDSNNNQPGTKSRKLSTSKNVKIKEDNNNSSSSNKKLSSTNIEENLPVEEIVKDVINDMICLVENSDCVEYDPPIKNLNENENDDDKFIIEQCLTYLKKLCHTFIKNHLFLFNDNGQYSQDQIDKSFKSLFSSSSSISGTKQQIQNDDGYQAESTNTNNLYLIKLKPNCLSYLQSFQILNKLLIKMLFFPREQKPLHQQLNRNNSEETTESNEFLAQPFEDWLKDLFVISASSTLPQSKSLFEFQSITLNTLIELIQLSESVNSHFSLKLAQSQNQSDPKCLLQSIFSKKQIDFIYNQSKFGYLTAQMLWSHLSNNNNSNSQSDSQSSSTDKRASILFCLLHELLPNNLCEEIIINNLLIQQNVATFSDIYVTSNLTQKVDSFKRFTRLWHWSRELNSNNDLTADDNFLNSEDSNMSTMKYGKLTKTFERSLLILLDMLGREETPRALSKLIQEWLISCITDYNDLARLTDILLISLLHPSTARVSVQYFINNLFNLTSTGTPNKSLGFYLNEENDDGSDSGLNYESKVYAISNEGGNVKYHVNETSTNKTSSQTNQQLFLLTSLDQSTQLTNSSSLNNTSSSSTTKPLRNTNVELPLSILNAASLANQGSGISLRINPFLVSKNTSNGDLEDLDDTEQDQVDTTKNARLLENYKAIKAGQLKDKEVKQTKTSPNTSPNSSPSIGSSLSPRNLETQNGTIPTITIEQSNRLSLETNQSDDINDLDEDMDEDDDENEDLDEDQDENDYEGFINSDEDFDEDSTSQTTDITLLSSNVQQQMDKSPNLMKKLRNNVSQKSPKPKSKKDKKKLSKNNSSSTLNKSSKSNEKSNEETLSRSGLDLNSNNLKPKQFIQKPFCNGKELTVDLQNPIDINYSYMLIYINCNNIQTSLHSNKLMVSSTFSNSSYDHVRTLFILKCIEQFIAKCTKEFLISISTTTITNLSNQKLNSNQQVFSVHNEKLLDLILKHIKSIYGENFYASTNNSSALNFNLNNTTYLEAITLVLLLYIRSYYPPSRFMLKTTTGEDIKIPKSASINSIQSAAINDLIINTPIDDSRRELNDLNFYQENRNIQIYALKILSKLFKELNAIASPSANIAIQKSIIDYLDKLKIQKTLLHLFYSTIHQPGQNTLSSLIIQSSNSNTSKQIQYSYVTELISCLENLIELERILNDYQLTFKFLKNGITTNPSTARLNDFDQDDFLLTLIQNSAKKVNPAFGVSTVSSISTNSNSSQSTKYIPSQSIFNQSMFISSILYYLKNMSLVEYHLDILKLIKNTLPSCGNSLKSISTYIIEQLCRNLLYITNGGINSSGSSSSSTNYIQPIIAYMSYVSVSINIPDLIINMLKQLSYLLNYCLIGGPSSNSIFLSLSNDVNTDTQYKLFRQFQADNELNLIQAKECLIHLFPSIISSMAQVWQRCNLLLNSQNLYSGLNSTFDQQLYQQYQQHQQNYQYSWILGHPYVIKQCITDLLNPIAQHHSIQFMMAIGSVWGERRKKSRVYQEHKVIIELIKSLKAFPIYVIIQNITEILKQSSSNSNKDKKKSPSNIWLLQFLHSYLDYFLTSSRSRSNSNKSQTGGLLQPSMAALDPSINVNELATCLCTFFKESLSSTTTSNFAPACYFQLFRILHDSVNNFSVLVDDKKYSKDIQDATHKLFELCNSIVASSLQQTTWLRKNYAVKLTPQQPQTTTTTATNSTQQTASSGITNGSSASTPTSLGPATTPNSTVVAVGAGPAAGGGILIHSESNLSSMTTMTASTSISSTTATNTSGIGSLNSSANLSNSVNFPNVLQQQNSSNFSDVENDNGTNLNSIDHLNGFVGDTNDANNNLAYSLQALNILAEYLAKTLDIVYKSDEKDRLVIPILISLMSNLWPYLKTHSVANKNNFRAASHLLMSLTVYPYTRKTWKKEVFEMLFDNLYFHVDSATLEYSKTIIDNLISNDRAMFKDVLTRVTYQQSSGLFTSKEQESEQKAQLLKRLAFVIFSSEKDQYQKNMPEIQECIAHVLKLVQSANLYSTLFLLFRILLLRISSRHLIALWPTIISELILILLQIEQDLTEDIEIKNGSKSSFLDHIASTTTSNSSHGNNVKLQIYLSACKLLDLILTLPSSLTPQFQLYKWSFINTEDALNLKQKDQFVPYITKINNLLKIKFPNSKVTNYKTGLNGPLIRHKTIQSLVDLKPFFELVTTHQFVHSSNQTNSVSNQQLQQTQSVLATTNLKLFEANVHEDFLDGWIQ